MYSIINDPSLNTINNNSITYPNNLYYNNNLIVYQNIINNYINYFQHTLHYLENCNYTMQQLNVNLYNSINPNVNTNPYYNNNNQQYNNNHQYNNNQHYNNNNQQYNNNQHYNNNYSSNNTDMNNINNDVVNSVASNNLASNSVASNNVAINTISDNDNLVTPSFRFPDILLQAINNINNYYREYNQDDNQDNYQNSIEYFREISNKNIDDVIINNINRKYFYEIRNPINIECGITQEEFSQDDEVAVIEECGHIFTYNNLFQWCRTNLTCPNCRYNMLIGQNLIKYTENDNTQFYIFTPTQIAEFITFRSRNILEST